MHTCMVFWQKVGAGKMIIWDCCQSPSFARNGLSSNTWNWLLASFTISQRQNNPQSGKWARTVTTNLRWLMPGLLRICLRSQGWPCKRVWNCNETASCTSDTPKNLLTRRGTWEVHEPGGGSGREYITVLGAGVKLPPYIVYKCKHLYHTWCLGGPVGAPEWQWLGETGKFLIMVWKVCSSQPSSVHWSCGVVCWWSQFRRQSWSH